MTLRRWRCRCWNTGSSCALNLRLRASAYRKSFSRFCSKSRFRGEARANLELKAFIMKKRLFRISLGVVIGLLVLAGGIWVLTLTLGERPVRYYGKSRYDWSVDMN